jgi:hypothetical protein
MMTVQQIHEASELIAQSDKSNPFAYMRAAHDIKRCIRMGDKEEIKAIIADALRLIEKRDEESKAAFKASVTGNA